MLALAKKSFLSSLKRRKNKHARSHQPQTASAMRAGGNDADFPEKVRDE